jgi:hypothetical protein
MKRALVRFQAPSASQFVRQYLNWHLIKDDRVTEMTIKLKLAISREMDINYISKYSYRFFKYARFSKKKNTMIYGLALAGWRHYKKYSLYPNLWSYLEVENIKHLDQAIDAIIQKFDKILELNKGFLKSGFGLFAIPRSLYQNIIQEGQNTV